MKSGTDPNSTAAFQTMCKKFNLKVTPQRMAVYEALTAAHNHPSADAVYKKVRERYPNISFDTVNRTLHTFIDIGAVEPVEGHGGPRRYDPNIDMHHHFHCVECGAIIDLYADMFKRIEIPFELEQQFTITGKRIILKGYCAKCRKK